MVCEKCHGPITKLKRYGNSSKQFCSRQCAQSEQGEKVWEIISTSLVWYEMLFLFFTSTPLLNRRLRPRVALIHIKVYVSDIYLLS